MTEEKRQKQGPDVASVDIGVGHDDDLVVARLVDLHFVIADPATDGGDQRADLGRGQHLVGPRAFHIQDLAAQWQNGLIAAVAPLLCRPAGGITLDKEYFGFRRVAFLADCRASRPEGVAIP